MVCWNSYVVENYFRFADFHLVSIHGCLCGLQHVRFIGFVFIVEDLKFGKKRIKTTSNFAQ
jgi:hypothetical protein